MSRPIYNAIANAGLRVGEGITTGLQRAENRRQQETRNAMAQQQIDFQQQQYEDQQNARMRAEEDVLLGRVQQAIGQAQTPEQKQMIWAQAGQMAAERGAQWPEWNPDAEAKLMLYKPATSNSFSKFYPTEGGGLVGVTKQGNAQNIDLGGNAIRDTSTKVNVSNKQESEEAKTIGKFYGEQFADIQKTGLAASKSDFNLDLLEKAISNKDVYSGIGGEAVLKLKKVGTALGMDFSGIPDSEVVAAVGNQMALEMRNPAGGAGMPGAMSDKDREFLVSIVPGLTKTQDGNLKLIEYRRLLNQRNRDVAKKAREYRKKNGRLDEGFFDELQAWSDQNPLFPDAAKNSGTQNTSVDDLVNKYAN